MLFANNIIILINVYMEVMRYAVPIIKGPHSCRGGFLCCTKSEKM